MENKITPPRPILRPDCHINIYSLISFHKDKRIGGSRRFKQGAFLHPDNTMHFNHTKAEIGGSSRFN